MTIIWTKEAMADYEQNVSYLQKKWPQKTIINFISSVNKHLSLIEDNPNLFPFYQNTKIKVAPIVPQINLFFKLDSEHIVLLRFWNNAMNPNKMNL